MITFGLSVMQYTAYVFASAAAGKVTMLGMAKLYQCLQSCPFKHIKETTPILLYQMEHWDNHSVNIL